MHPVNYKSYSRVLLLLIMATIAGSYSSEAQQMGVNDTIIVKVIPWKGDTIEAKTLSELIVYSQMTEAQMSVKAKWTRLRNAVYVTYPYARKAGAVMNEINRMNANITSDKERKKNIHSKEKQLKKEFTDPLTNLSVYQGKVLMKLINRETHNNCYEIIKEYKGAITARLYQTVAFIFGSNLKQPYDATGEDAEMEQIAREVERMYGYRG